jgi:hypothetical protein
MSTKYFRCIEPLPDDLKGLAIEQNIQEIEATQIPRRHRPASRRVDANQASGMAEIWGGWRWLYRLNCWKRVWRRPLKNCGLRDGNLST